MLYHIHINMDAFLHSNFFGKKKLITFSRFSILLAHDVASHLSVILSASHASLNARSVQPRVTLVTRPVKCNSVKRRAWRGTPVQGPSNNAYVTMKDTLESK